MIRDINFSPNSNTTACCPEKKFLQFFSSHFCMHVFAVGQKYIDLRRTYLALNFIQSVLRNIEANQIFPNEALIITKFLKKPKKDWNQSIFTKSISDTAKRAVKTFSIFLPQTSFVVSGFSFLHFDSVLYHWTPQFIAKFKGLSLDSMDFQWKGSALRCYPTKYRNRLRCVGHLSKSKTGKFNFLAPKTAFLLIADDLWLLKHIYKT